MTAGGTKSFAFDDPSLSSTCEGCGAIMHRAVGEALHGGRRHWHVEATCEDCGNGWINCGSDDPPPGVRDALIAAYGWSTVRVGAGSVGRGALLLKCVREVYGGSLAEARQTADALRASGVQGTQVDAEILAGALRRAGFPAEIMSGSREGGAK
ncbi:hypothetical protein [Streptomyces sp. NPDC058572]|uniref:hypothetical protein n=1 Tax=Streptomyces sp. NPDC058572 TaxID=3346546 RepID=UPI003648DD38